MLGYVEYGSFVTHRVSFANRTQMNDILLTLKARGISGKAVDTAVMTNYERAFVPRADMSYAKFKESIRKENQIKIK